ncbi:MAG TPA: T9SS type A sorting domain-containing protein [Saprospiraceae bacterium]|nr:T9SS type A sorting domain-containing protein [Saprospiraceae bacterium]
MKKPFTKDYIILPLFICVLHGGLSALGNNSFWGLVCPNDTTVSCLESFHNLDKFGQAFFIDNWGKRSVGNPTVKFNLGKCNTGTITRTWKYMDPYWRVYTCSQTITVTGGGSFNSSHITWPQDIVVSGCTADISPHALKSFPTWHIKPCSEVLHSFKDMWFNHQGTCSKIIRTWTVIDWCVYHPTYNPHQGIWKRNQVIKIMFEESPDIHCPGDVVAFSTNCTSADVKIPPLTIGNLHCSGTAQIDHNSPYAKKKGADISGIYPVGKTKVTYTISFGCGQKTKCEVWVEVKSDKAPTPYCINNTSVALMGIDTNGDGFNDAGMVEIKAKSLDQGSIAHCNSGPLKFSFSSNPHDDTKIFTCDNVGINNVQVWVTNAFGKQDFCVVQISVQNNAAGIPSCEAEDPEDGEPGGEENGEEEDDEEDDEEEEEEEEEEDNNDGEEDNEDGERMIISGKVQDPYGSSVSGVKIEIKNMHEHVVIDSQEVTIIEYDMIPRINRMGVLLYMMIPKEVTKVVRDTARYYIKDTLQTSEEGLYQFMTSDLESPGFLIQGIEPVHIRQNITMVDVQTVLEHVAGIKKMEHPYQLIAADVNNDGIIDMNDVLEMIEWIAGERQTFSGGMNHKFYKDHAGEKENMSDPGAYNLPYMVDHWDEDLSDINFYLVYLGKVYSDHQDLQRDIQTRSSEVDAGHVLTYNLNDLRNNLERYFRIDENRVRLFPNPVVENFQVEIINNNQEGWATLWLFGTDGRLYMRRDLLVQHGKTTENISVQALPSGMYLYKVEMNREIFNGKIIKY